MLLSKLHQLSTNVVFLFQHSIQDLVLYLVAIYTCYTICSSSSAFLAFHAYDTFEEYSSTVLQNAHKLGIIWCFHRLRLYIIVKNTTNNVVPFSVLHIKGFVMSICLIPSDVYLDRQVKMVSARFLQYKVTVLSFVVGKYLGGHT